MMKNFTFLLISIILVLFQSINLSQPDTLWTKTFGGSGNDYGRQVILTQDTSLIILGRKAVTNGIDFWLIKTDLDGNVIWESSYDFYAIDYESKILETAEGDYLISGISLDGDCTDGGISRIILLKIDAFGQEIWRSTFDYSPYFCIFSTDLSVTPDGNYIIMSFIQDDVLALTKVDGDGNQLWEKLKSNFISHASRIELISDDEILIVGHYNYQLVLYAIDAQGNSLWTKYYGDLDHSISILNTNDDNYVIAGNISHSGGMDYSFWLGKFNSSGDSLWTRSYLRYSEQFNRSVFQTSDGGYVLAGYQKNSPWDGDLLIIKTDELGMEQWSTMFLRPDRREKANSIIQLPNGSYIVCGEFENDNSNTDVWLVKFESENPIPVELTSFTALTTKGIVTLNWATATETNNLGFEIERKIISKNNEGNWSRIGFQEGHGTTTEPQSYSFIDDINALNSVTIKYRLKQIDYDGSYEYSIVVEVTNLSPTDFVLHQNYPNPFNPSTVIKFGLPIKSNVQLNIYNTVGEKVAQLINDVKPAGNYEIEFDAANLPSGIYFYKLQAGRFLKTKKMLLLK